MENVAGKPRGQRKNSPTVMASLSETGPTALAMSQFRVAVQR